MGADQPWAAAGGRLAAGTAASPAAGGPVVVRPLGTHDALADPAPEPAPGSMPEPGAVPVHPYGHQVVVGPVGGSPCPTCLARRWQAVRPDWLRDTLELGTATRAAGDPPQWTLPFALDALAAAAAAIRARPAGDPAPVLLLDLETLRVRAAAVLADATCPACGGAADDTPQGARVDAGPVPKRSPGSFRVRELDELPLPLDALVNPVAGMLGGSVLPDLASLTTSTVTGWFTLRSTTYLRETYWGGHTPSYRRSLRVGVLEGLERLAGMRPRGKRTGVVASLDKLAADGLAALDPRTCGTYDPDFHRDSEVRPFAPDREIPWVWGWSLRDERPVLVPEVLTYYSAPGGLRDRFVQESSNGCASGGCLTEAVYFGLMEVLERDAFLLAWYGRARLAEIDPASVRRPHSRALIDRLRLIGYTPRFFDTRVSFPVPVVTAVAVRADGGLGALCFGAGASLDPEDALAAGLAEIATDAANLRRRTERDEPRLRALAADFEQVRTLHDHPLLYGIPEMRRHAGFLLDGPTDRVELGALAPPAGVPGPDLAGDLGWCVRMLADRGFDVVAVEQTGPEQRALGLATASVLVPGLLPIDFGWRRQRALRMPRLRTALREAGRTDRDLGPADLNPAPHPFP